MTKKNAAAKTQRTRYSTKFKQRAVLRAVKDGMPVVAQDLGIEPAQLSHLYTQDDLHARMIPEFFKVDAGGAGFPVSGD